MNINLLIDEMFLYFSGDPKRIQHFIKVYEFARLIGMSERLSDEEQEILETAAVVHDIGVKHAEEKYGSSAGKLQEQEGPEAAGKILLKLGYCEKITERVKYLVGHHHTYDNIADKDYRILVEADFLVNMYEDSLSEEAVKKAYEKIFRTENGKRLCRIIYGIK